MVAMSLIIPFRNSGLIIQSTSHELFGPGWVHQAVMVTSLFTPHLTNFYELILLMSYCSVPAIDNCDYSQHKRLMKLHVVKIVKGLNDKKYKGSGQIIDTSIFFNFIFKIRYEEGGHTKAPPNYYPENW